MNIIHYAVAKIEFKNANHMNEITRLRSQIPSNEFVTDESEHDHPVLSVGSNSYIPGTLKPETVLSRPYNNQKDIRYIQNLRSRNSIVAYNPNNLSLYLNKGSIVEFGKSHEKDGSKTKLSSQLDQILNHDAPTMTSSSDIEDEENTIFSPPRKRNFVLVQSNDGKVYSLYDKQSKQNEHQAQRPPTWKAFSGYRLLNISHQQRYGVPEPTFQSVSPPDLQIEKVDGTYLNASDSTFHHREKTKK